MTTHLGKIYISKLQEYRMSELFLWNIFQGYSCDGLNQVVNGKYGPHVHNAILAVAPLINNDIYNTVQLCYLEFVIAGPPFHDLHLKICKISPQRENHGIFMYFPLFAGAFQGSEIDFYIITDFERLSHHKNFSTDSK